MTGPDATEVPEFDPTPAGAARAGTILLVEDNPDDVTFAIRAFRKNDFSNEIVVASDGVQALEMLFPPDGREPLRPAIMLLDLNLPLLNGISVLRRLREDHTFRALPVIVLTTSSEERDLVDSYEFGANSFITKPVNFRHFLEAAKLLGIYWLTLNRTPGTT